jgi:hypothetical protein
MFLDVIIPTAMNCKESLTILGDYPPRVFSMDADMLAALLSFPFKQLIFLIKTLSKTN